MKILITHPFIALLLPLLFLSSCFGQERNKDHKSSQSEYSFNSVAFTDLLKVEADVQIAKYVVEIFGDSNEHLWFGTMSKGVARFDGQSLKYFTQKDGLGNNTVASIAEDQNGNIWMATHAGLTRYDGTTFTTYTTKDGLPHNRISHVMVDSKGLIWIGTWGGVGLFDGKNFSVFKLPNPEVMLKYYQTTMDWVTEIIEDSKGNIWISRDGYGVCKYNGKTFQHFTKKEGLPSNNVQNIQEDQQGNIWIACRITEKDSPDPSARTGDGGLCRYDGKEFTRFTDWKGLSRNEIYALYVSRSGDLWIGANGTGAYRYDGQQFELFSETDREDLMPYGFAIQSIWEDHKGTFWFGMSGGLFRLSDKLIGNVTKEGPWD